MSTLRARLPDLDLEVADEAGDLLDLGVGEDPDVGLEAHSTILGVRMQAAQSSVGKVLSYWAIRPADGGGALDEGHLVAGIRDVQRRLDPGDPAADHQRPLGDRNLGLGERLVAADLGDGHPGEVDGLGGGRVLVVVDPGAVLADVGHLRHVRVEARLGDALRNVGSCRRGEQAATTTRSKRCSAMAWRTMACPGSEHIYL